MHDNGHLINGSYDVLMPSKKVEPHPMDCFRQLLLVPSTRRMKELSIQLTPVSFTEDVSQESQMSFSMCLLLDICGAQVNKTCSVDWWTGLLKSTPTKEEAALCLSGKLETHCSHCLNRPTLIPVAHSER